MTAADRFSVYFPTDLTAEAWASGCFQQIEALCAVLGMSQTFYQGGRSEADALSRPVTIACPKDLAARLVRDGFVVGSDETFRDYLWSNDCRGVVFNFERFKHFNSAEHPDKDWLLFEVETKPDDAGLRKAVSDVLSGAAKTSGALYAEVLSETQAGIYNVPDRIIWQGRALDLEGLDTAARKAALSDLLPAAAVERTSRRAVRGRHGSTRPP